MNDLKKLFQLDLNSNKFEEVPKINSMNDLRKIVLRQNLIKKVSNGTFDNLDNLQYLGKKNKKK